MRGKKRWDDGQRSAEGMVSRLSVPRGNVYLHVNQSRWSFSSHDSKKRSLMQRSAQSLSDPLTLTFGHQQLIIRRRYEVLSILNDFFIALWFLVGRVLFFFLVLSTSSF